MNSIKKIVFGLLTLLVFTACEPETIVCQPDSIESGVLVLNEGLFQQNNSTLSFYNESTNSVSQQIYNTINGVGLGDTGNDMIQYGSKIYILVNVSGTIEVIDAKSFEHQTRVDVKENGSSVQPRSMISANGFIYFTNFNGEVWQMDTTNYQIENKIQVGRNPEGLDVLNDKIFVANSGGLDAPNYDSTLSVIDINTHTVEQTIDIEINPSKVVAFNDYIYIISRGNYTDIAPSLCKINASSLIHESTYFINPIDIAKYNNELYVAYRQTSNGPVQIGIINPATGGFSTPILISDVGTTTFYGIDMDSNGNIYVKDANGYVNSGSVRIFDNNGTFIQEFTVGLNPNKTLKIN